MEEIDQEPEKIKCPKCGSTQITAGKHGFSAGKAVGGALLAGPLGLFAGSIGSKKVEITCLNCGNKFKPGEHLQKIEETPKAAVQKNDQPVSMLGCLGVVVVFVIIYYLLSK